MVNVGGCHTATRNVDSADMKRATEMFMVAESWPMGVFVEVL